MSDADAFKPILTRLAERTPLSADEAENAFRQIMEGVATPAQIGAFLFGLRMRGETVDEIAAAAKVMREKALPVEAPAGAVDTCGTGGDRSGTYNVSTAVALVAAGAGVPVAKHGNKALSSRSGSAEVLERLGVTLDVKPEIVAKAIREAGVGFMFAPLHHAAMKHVAPVRPELGTRTIFNLLGPLSNPAGATRQLMGVFAREWVEPLAHVLKALGSDRVWVVHGLDGLDEITTTGPTAVASLEAGEIRCFEVTPEEAGLERALPEDLKGGGPEENAEALERLLAGEKSAYRDIVLINAAAALIVADRAADLKEGVRLAAASIDEGAARKALDRLIEITGEAAGG